MWATPLHHKPIVYGSTAANLLFFAAVVAHVLPAIVAPAAAVVALASRKGGALHIRAGQLFVWSMAAVAITGIGIDLARLCFHVAENHTKYAGVLDAQQLPGAHRVPLRGPLRAVPAARVGRSPRLQRRACDARDGPRVGAVLLALGLGFAVLIATRFNPWTGALWMVATFCAFVAFMGRARLEDDRRARVARHRIGMIFLLRSAGGARFRASARRSRIAAARPRRCRRRPTAAPRPARSPRSSGCSWRRGRRCSCWAAIWCAGCDG